jgi:protein-S-isoprenylcysteine O-methyltransferase Ste14
VSRRHIARGFLARDNDSIKAEFALRSTAHFFIARVFAALLVIVSSLPFLLYRAITEDRVLQAELPGYADYARRVRWRLVPGIW